VALCLFAAVPRAGGPQQPATGQQPIFRTDALTVEVDARVFDRDGHFVTDLTRDDFEIVESGTPQQIQTLYLVEEQGAPPSAPAPDRAAPSDSPRTVSAPARQTWIFVFDLQHLTPGGDFDRARRAVESYIQDRFNEGDLGGIVAGTRMVNNRLTSVRGELVAAVRTVKPNSELRSRQIDLTREWPRLQDEWEAIRIANNDTEALRRALIRACQDDPSACSVVQPDVQVRDKARRIQTAVHRATIETLTALNGLASGLAKLPGPKTLVFLSDGFVVQDIETSLRQVVGQTARAGARVYAIDVRGLSRVGNAGLIDQAAVGDPAGGPPRIDGAEDGPNSLAIDTGGLMIRNENNIGRALDEIARDANRYYVLGYQPSNTVLDGKFRPIEVRVKRPGLKVRARRGYLALEPARMLAPARITQPSDDPEGAPPARHEEAKEEEDTPAVEADPGPATAVAAGSTVSTDPVARDGFRVRPDADRRVRDLADREGLQANAAASRGWEAYQRGDVETAARELREAAASPGARPWVFYTLGYSQLALGKPNEALASWRRVLEQVPGFKPVYLDLADTYLQLSDLTPALELLRLAEQRWPADAEIQNAIGVIHTRRGALDQAIDAFSRSTTVEPDNPLGFFNLARAYEMRYARTRRYVSSQRRWTSNEDDRRRAAANYERYVQMGGPYEQAARDALRRLEWSK
jgi:VWFA-related protein